MGLILLKETLPAEQLDPAATLHPDEQAQLTAYDAEAQGVFETLQAKNHDYGEAWRSMRATSFTDLILMKLLRIKQIEDRQGRTDVSEGIDAGYADILNYAVFYFIQMRPRAYTKPIFRFAYMKFHWLVFFLLCVGLLTPGCDSACVKEPCRNGGICDEESGNCTCPQGFTGAKCGQVDVEARKELMTKGSEKDWRMAAVQDVNGLSRELTPSREKRPGLFPL